MRRLAFFPVLFLLFPTVFAVPSQVEFTGTLEAIDSVEQVLTVRITPSFTLQVRIMETTEIRDGDSQLDLVDLELDSVLRIEGFFTDEGITAREIVVSEPDDDLELRGQITEIDEDNRIIVVLGFPIHVPETAEIKGPDGPLTFQDLAVDQHVKVEANVVDEQIVASEVKVGVAKDERFAHISFEGIVLTVADEMIEVLIDDLETPVGVEIGETTLIKGELAPGVLVRVIGHLNEDLTVTADIILVRSPLQLAPPHLNMRVVQIRNVQIILQNPLDSAVSLLIESDDPSIAEVLPGEVVIEAGQKTASFEVTGISVGNTKVTVSLPAEFGGLSEEIEVLVREESDEEDNEEEGPSFTIRWAPPQLNVKIGLHRSSKLLLPHPLTEDTEAVLSLHEGMEGVVTFPEMVTIPAGAVFVDVLFEVEGPGEVVVRAELPTGEIADLKFRVLE